MIKSLLSILLIIVVNFVTFSQNVTIKFQKDKLSQKFYKKFEMFIVLKEDSLLAFKEVEPETYMISKIDNEYAVINQIEGYNILFKYKKESFIVSFPHFRPNSRLKIRFYKTGKTYGTVIGRGSANWTNIVKNHKVRGKLQWTSPDG